MNIGRSDASIRLTLGLGLLILSLDAFAIIGKTTLTWTVGILLALAAAMTLTGLTRVCPVYGLFGIQRAD